MLFFEIQPAPKIYAFDRGWRIMKYVTKNLFKRTDVAARWWFNKAQDAMNYGRTRSAFIKYWMYVIVLGLWMAGAAQYVSAMLLACLFLAVQTILLSIWVAISMVMIGFLTLCTFVYGRFYRIFFRCPDCYEQMSIPIFICPTCSTEHSQLWPSIYGVFAHQCEKCSTKLPTLRLKIPGVNLIERDSLKRICPGCHVQLNAGIGTGTNLHIPIVGGPSTGKSNFIVMATREFKQTYEQVYHYTITFTDSKHELDYNANVKLLSTGHELLKTTEIVAHAYNLKIQSPRVRVPKLAYIYDAAGEAYNSSENTKLQEFFKYIDGIIFVIDPFAILGYRRMHESEIQQYQNLIRPSALDVMQAYERMFQMFEDSVGLRKGKRFPHPLAVVMTKVDALNLDFEVGTHAARNMLLQNPTIANEEDAINILVRDFLVRYELDHFVREVEMQFSNVRYFSCSALGRMPDESDNRCFMPIRVADPLLWLLARAKAIDPIPGNGRSTRLLDPPTMTMRQRS